MDKQYYDSIIHNINALLMREELYPKYIKSIQDGKNDFTISQVYTVKNYDSKWIDTIEDTITALDTIVRNPRKFIVIEEDIVDISLARSISVESVKHLSQHTNLISSVTKDGMVIPSKILNTSKEESFEIYENRFVYTLLLKVRDFIDIRFEKMKQAIAQSGELGVNVKSDFVVDGHKINYDLTSNAHLAFEATVKKKKDGQLSDVDRIVRMNSIIGDFLSSAFAKEMRSCALVRPPIQRTNVILKDPNFKKALLLWQYVESNENMEFKVETSTETMELSPSVSEKYRSMIFLNTILMQSIASAKDSMEPLAETMKKDVNIESEYITKNIDDFVPDDFPELKMKLDEIRRIYYKIPGQKTMKLTDISKMNAALDRVLRQYKINKAKEDSIRQQRLIEEQQREEEEAKRLALREAREEERRKKREEALRIKEERRLEAERLATIKRIEQERVAAEKAAEKERIRLAREEADLLAKEEEKKLQERLRLEEEEKQRRLEAERERLAEENRLKKEAEWEVKKEKLIAWELRKRKKLLAEIENEEILKIVRQEDARIRCYRKALSVFNTALEQLPPESLITLLGESLTAYMRASEGDVAYYPDIYVNQEEEQAPTETQENTEPQKTETIPEAPTEPTSEAHEDLSTEEETPSPETTPETPENKKNGKFAKLFTIGKKKK